ncbi:MAG: hypothetical protein H7Z16_00580 [Pyrinomonadaceae bacterium]|nr:hypothetical protein [Pyrinomonadaceae bacterium]
MKLHQRIIKLALLGTCLLCISNAPIALGQSTIFDKPSTDVESPGKVYLELNFITHFASYADGGYQTYGPRVVVGLPGNTEVGVNGFYTRAKPGEPIVIEPNFKWQFYADETKGLAAGAGVLLSIPVTRRSKGTTRAMLYAVGSKTFEGRYGPRVTAGGYTLAGWLEKGTTKHGVLLGYEQPVTSKISFLADWASGNNDYGYVVAGAGITLSPKDSFYAGYNFGNQGRGNNSLGLYYGRNF